MSREIEDRLRRALDARAEQVTHDSLRPAEALPPAERARSRRPGRTTWAWIGAAAATAAAVTGILVGVSLSGDDSAPSPADQTALQPRPTVVRTGSDCPDEAALIAAALDRSRVQADVDGDGRNDAVVVTADPGADATCRAFVGVRTATGATYSTALDGANPVPAGMTPEVVALPDLGADGDAEIVVDTHARADGALALLFTLTSDGLVWVPTSAFEDGTFYVEGAGVTEPRGADCTADGDLVLSMALAVDQGRRFEVTRHVYPATGDPLRLGSPTVDSTTVPADSLVERFPEFGTRHFDACS